MRLQGSEVQMLLSRICVIVRCLVVNCANKNLKNSDGDPNRQLPRIDGDEFILHAVHRSREAWIRRKTTPSGRNSFPIGSTPPRFGLY